MNCTLTSLNLGYSKPGIGGVTAICEALKVTLLAFEYMERQLFVQCR